MTLHSLAHLLQFQMVTKHSVCHRPHLFLFFQAYEYCRSKKQRYSQCNPRSVLVFLRSLRVYLVRQVVLRVSVENNQLSLALLLAKVHFQLFYFYWSKLLRNMFCVYIVF